MRLVEAEGVSVEGVDSAYLDCISDNFAALLRHKGVPDVRTPFACQWHFDLDESDRLPVPVLERTPVEEVVREQTGFELEEVVTDDYVEACADLVRRDEPVLAIGDAFLMPWQPYFGRQHLVHSFVIDGVANDRGAFRIADAYENRTQWGAAVPSHAIVDASDLPAILQSSDGWRGRKLSVVRRADSRPQALEPAELVLRNAAEMRGLLGERRPIEQFAEHYSTNVGDPEAVAAFGLACWEISRARGLHALWLRDVAGGGPTLTDEDVSAFDEIATAWRRTVEFSFVMDRRVQAGRTPPMAAFDLIGGTIAPAERAWAERVGERVVG